MTRHSRGRDIETLRQFTGRRPLRRLIAQGAEQGEPDGMGEGGKAGYGVSSGHDIRVDRVHDRCIQVR